MINRRTLLAAGAAAAAIAQATAAFGHEGRTFPASAGSIQLYVGFHGEPAFEDTYNAVDIYAYTYDGPCKADPSDFVGKPIDNSPGTGDVMNLSVEALYLKDQTKPTGPLGNSLPASAILKSLKITADSPLKQAWSSPGLYNSYFRPTHPGNTKTGGAYGFHIFGSVHAKEGSYQCAGDANPTPIKSRNATINAYFVCGNGGLGDESFSCVQTSQPFPGTSDDAYKPNKAFGASGGGS